MVSEKEDAAKSSVYQNEHAANVDVEKSTAPILLDPVALKALQWKCDLRIIPPLFVIFLLAFLDRTNIGNARIQGLEKSLHMKGQDYNIALFIFFIPYILLEVPSNIIIKNVAPSTWLSIITILWGIATIGQGLVRNFGGLLAMRFIVGIFEAGLFPGCIYLISMYYKRYELQWRLSLFFTASIIAGAFGGLLAYAIAKMDGVRGYEGWRWIFILEGLFTAVIGVISKFCIVDWPETATFLNEDERAMLIEKLSQDTGEARMNRLDKVAAKRIFSDWKIWVGTFMYMGVVTTGYSSSFFIPTILKQLGYTASMAQVRSIPIFVVATVVALVVALCTDHLKHRYSFIILGVLVGSTGYIIMLCMDSVTVGVRYMACFFIVTGGYIAQPVTLAWLSNQMGGHYKRSVSAAIQIGIGNSGGIIASNIFITKEAPKYHTGFGTAVGLLIFCGVMATVMFFGIKAENKKRDAGGRDYRYQETAHLDNMGDDHPTFRFTT